MKLLTFKLTNDAKVDTEPFVMTFDDVTAVAFTVDGCMVNAAIVHMSKQEAINLAFRILRTADPNWDKVQFVGL